MLQLIAEGHTTKAIAKGLDISVKTAEAYRGELMKALDIHDIASLTRYAIRSGLVSLGPLTRFPASPLRGSTVRIP